MYIHTYMYDIHIYICLCFVRAPQQCKGHQKHKNHFGGSLILTPHKRVDQEVFTWDEHWLTSTKFPHGKSYARSNLGALNGILINPWTPIFGQASKFKGAENRGCPLWFQFGYKTAGFSLCFHLSGQPILGTHLSPTAI